MSLKICGSCASLGKWNLVSAPAMTWTEGDVWMLQTQIPNEAVEAKCVAVSDDGEYVEWETGENRIIEIPDEVREQGVVQVTLQYGQTETAEVTAKEKGQAIVEDVENLATAKTAEMTETELPVEQTEVHQEARDPQPSEAEQQDTNDSAQDTMAQERLDSTSVVSEESSSAMPPDTLILPKSSKETNQPTAVPSDSERQTLESEETVKKLKEITKASNPGDNEDSRYPASPKETPETTQQSAWVTALGAVSLPVMFWSEYTLYQTGCGLPPGPEGILGAAEGISYLVISGIFLLSIFRRSRPNAKANSTPILLEIGSLLAVMTGILVLVSQVQTFGYIPSALPDQNCPAEPTSFSSLLDSLSISDITLLD